MAEYPGSDDGDGVGVGGAEGAGESGEVGGGSSDEYEFEAITAAEVLEKLEEVSVLFIYYYSLRTCGSVDSRNVTNIFITVLGLAK